MENFLNPKKPVELGALLNAEETRKFMQAKFSEHYKTPQEFLNTPFVDITIGEIVYFNSFDIFEVPYADMVLRLLFDRFELHIKTLANVKD